MASDTIITVHNPMLSAPSNNEIRGIWCDLNLKCLNDWSSKAMQYRWMHNYAASSFKHRADMLSVSVALFGYVSGGSVLTSSVDQSWLRFFVAFLSIGAGVLTNIQSVLGWKELAEKHHQTSKQFSRIHQDIVSQLSLDPSQREDPRIYINNMKKEYTDAMNNAPTIPLWITKIYRDKLEAAEEKRKKRQVIADIGGNTVFVRGEFVQPSSLNEIRPSIMSGDVSPGRGPMAERFRSFVRKHMVLTAATAPAAPADSDDLYLDGVTGEAPARRFRHIAPTPIRNNDERTLSEAYNARALRTPKPGSRSASPSRPAGGRGTPVHRYNSSETSSDDSDSEDNSDHEKMSRGSRRDPKHFKISAIPSLASARRGSNPHFTSPLGPEGPINEQVVVSIAVDPSKHKSSAHDDDDKWLD